MRRMYSVKELSDIIYSVMGQYIEDGAFDETIENDILDYIAEHPIDPTAITGLDIAPKDVTATGTISGLNIYKKEFEMTFQLASNLSALTETQRYKKSVVLNQVLHIVGIHQVKNETGSAMNIGTGSNGFYFSVDSATASKIYTISGATLPDAPNYSIVSLFDAYFTVGNTRYSMPAKLSKSSGTGLYIEFSYPNISLNDGESIWVVVRSDLLII